MHHFRKGLVHNRNLLNALMTVLWQLFLPTVQLQNYTLNPYKEVITINLEMQ